MIFQWTLVLLGILSLWKTYRQFKKERVSAYWFSIWSVFWIVVVFVAFLPQTTDLIANTVGVERGADLIVYIAVLVLSYAVYRLMVGQERMRQEITDLVRQIAILEARRDQERNEKGKRE